MIARSLSRLALLAKRERKMVCMAGVSALAFSNASVLNKFYSTVLHLARTNGVCFMQEVVAASEADAEASAEASEAVIAVALAVVAAASAVEDAAASIAAASEEGDVAGDVVSAAAVVAAVLAVAAVVVSVEDEAASRGRAASTCPVPPIRNTSASMGAVTSIRRYYCPHPKPQKRQNTPHPLIFSYCDLFYCIFIVHSSSGCSVCSWKLNSIDQGIILPKYIDNDHDCCLIFSI